MTKKIYLFLTILYLGLLTGCKLDPAVIPANLQNPALNGKWFLKSIEVETEVSGGSPSDGTSVLPYDDFTNKDYFEFKANNAATYSSTLIGKTYEGYYTSNSSAAPQTLTFKSVNFSVNFYIRTISANMLVLYQTRSATDNGITTSITNTYTYQH